MTTDGFRRAGEIEALIAAVLPHALNRDSDLHGPDHWRRVARFGERLAVDVRAADRLVVRLFAVLHDSMRVNDGHDPEHGPRAALLALNLNGGPFNLGPTELATLEFACRGHADGQLTADPTIGVCWDADRLDLWRLAIVPDPALLSTEVARRPEVIEWARDVVRG